MALSILRTASCRSLMSRPMWSYPACLSSMNQSTSTAPPSPAESQAEFWKKNEALKRPMSPWMIYKFQLTSMLSITHRATGLGLGVLLYGWGVQSCFAGNTNWAQSLQWIHSTFPQWTLYSMKVMVATAIGYHFVNGIRHLLWDMGYGFSLKELYSSGYFVIGVTIILGLLAALNA